MFLQNSAIDGEKREKIAEKFLIDSLRGVLVQWRIEESGFEIDRLGKELAEGYLKGRK